MRRLAVLLTAVLLGSLVAATPAAAEDRLQFHRYANVHSGKCLDVEQHGDINGSPAVQRACNPGFFFYSKDAGGLTSYLVLPDYPSPKCLEVEAFSTDNFASVAQHDCNGGPHQQWRELPSGYTGDSRLSRMLRDSVMLQNVWSGKCLDVLNYSVDEGARVVQYDCYGGWNQLWFVTVETRS